MSRIWKNIGLMFMALWATVVFAQDAVLKPFVLASKGAGDVAQKVEATKAALAKAGFTVAGSYSPYPEATIIVVTNDEMLLEMLLNDVETLDSEIKSLSQSRYSEIDIIAKLFHMIGHLLGWAYFVGEFFRTPIYFQTEKQREDSLQKARCLKTGFDIAYRKRRIVLQLRNEGVSYQEIAFVLKITEANVKSLENARHIDEFRETFLKRRES